MAARASCRWASGRFPLHLHSPACWPKYLGDRPGPVESLEELRALKCELEELSDSVAAALLERAERCFLAWEMDKGERFLEQALNRVQESLERPTVPLMGINRYFDLCGRAVAQVAA